MSTMKKFFIYFLIVILFYIFSRVIIYFTLDTMFQYKKVIFKTPIPIEVELQATSENGFIKGKIVNEIDRKIKDKYIEIKFYSKNDVLMGTQYIGINEICTNEEKEFEIHFNYNRVDRAELDIVDEKTEKELSKFFIVLRDNVDFEKVAAIAGVVYILSKFKIIF